MRFDSKVLCGLVGSVMILGMTASKVIAADAYPVFTEIDSTTGSFNGPWSGPFGALHGQQRSVAQWEPSDEHRAECDGYVLPWRVGRRGGLQWRKRG